MPRLPRLPRLLLCCFLLTSCGARSDASSAESTESLGADSLVLLQYHFVSATTPRSTSVTPEEFEAHLALLASEGFTIVDLPSALATLRAGGTLAPRSAAITFDDGYRSVYSEALPRLAARGWPFTVFVNPGPIDAGSRLHADWPALAEMQAAGATIANHGMAHAFLARRDPHAPPESDAAFDARMRAEITAAEDRIEAMLGVRHGLFAYPYGEYDDRMRAWLEREGYVAIGQHSGVVWSGSDYRALPRFPFSGSYAEADQFLEKVRMRPLPVLNAESLDDPLRATTEASPVLVFDVDAGALRAGTIACYATRQGRMDVSTEHVAEDRLRISARPTQPLPLGRSRYNCTARHGDGGWLWFSQPWLRLGPDGEAPH